MKLNGRVAIVTGAASGLGKAIAVRFAQEGAKVAIADLNKQGADAVAREIESAGGRAISVAMDVTSEDDVNNGVAETAAAFGGIDVLVSNAGIQIVHPLEEFTFADWKKVLRYTSTARFSRPGPACPTCTSQAAAAALSTWGRYCRGKPRNSRRPM